MMTMRLSPEVQAFAEALELKMRRLSDEQTFALSTAGYLGAIEQAAREVSDLDDTDYAELPADMLLSAAVGATSKLLFAVLNAGALAAGAAALKDMYAEALMYEGES